MSIRFRRAWRIAGVVGVASLTVPMSPAGAESLRYQAGAAADGARLSVTIPGATVVDQVIDGGGPTAEAAVSSLGGSSALAAQPYPGELAIIGPGLGASLIGAPQPPAYPFVAASRYPSAPEQSVEPNPGYSLVARSTESTSEASARSGAANEASKVLLTQATATVKAEPGPGGRRGFEPGRGADRRTTVDRLRGELRPGRRQAQRRSRTSVVARCQRDHHHRAGRRLHRRRVRDAGRCHSTSVVGSAAQGAVLGRGGGELSQIGDDTHRRGGAGLQIVTTQAVPGVGRTATISLTLGRASANAQASTEAVELPADVPIAASPESAPDGSLTGRRRPDAGSHRGLRQRPRRRSTSRPSSNPPLPRRCRRRAMRRSPARRTPRQPRPRAARRPSVLLRPWNWPLVRRH